MIKPELVKELRHITSAPLMDCKRALVEANGDIEVAKQNLRKQGKILANKKSSRDASEGLVIIKNDSSKKKIAVLKLSCETDFVARNENFQDVANKLVALLLEEGASNFLEKNIDGLSVKDYLTEKIVEIRENILISHLEYWEYSDNSTVNSYLHHNKKIGAIIELEGESNEDSLQVAKSLCLHIAANKVECLSEQDLSTEVLNKEADFLKEQARQSGKPAEIIEKMIQGQLKKFKKEICLLEQPLMQDTSITVTQYLEQQAKNLKQDLKIRRFCKISF